MVQKQINAFEMMKNYPITDAHFQNVSYRSSNFQKNPCTHILEHAWLLFLPQTGTDRQTDRLNPIFPFVKLRLRGYKNITIGHNF